MQWITNASLLHNILRFPTKTNELHNKKYVVLQYNKKDHKDNSLFQKYSLMFSYDIKVFLHTDLSFGRLVLVSSPFDLEVEISATCCSKCCTCKAGSLKTNSNQRQYSSIDTVWLYFEGFTFVGLKIGDVFTLESHIFFRSRSSNSRI